MKRVRPAVGGILLMGGALWTAGSACGAPEIFDLAAREVLTPVELNCGDTLRFTLKNGAVRTLALEETGCEIIERPPLQGLVYGFSCRVRVDGHPLTLTRVVGAQESFCEPLVINGMRLWFDMALCVFDKIPMRYPGTGNLRQRPHKDARFAVQDAALPICPQPMRPWYRNTNKVIEIKSCYHGGDCWMGAFGWGVCHGGLDINQKSGEPLWAPIDFDDQWLFNSVANGDNNNRWRGIRAWPCGDVWALQTHHMVRQTVPERTPLQAGAHYAEAAGTYVGDFNHSHFEFKVGRLVNGKPPDFDAGGRLNGTVGDGMRALLEGQPEVFHLDPWILFWQIFETQREQEGEIRAVMTPPGPTRTGQQVTFDAGASRPGKGGCELRAFWSFGDGSGGSGLRQAHVFTRPGVYPVTLVVEDDTGRAQCVRHLTVDGPPLDKPVLGIRVADDPAFEPLPAGVTPVYGAPVTVLPHLLTRAVEPWKPELPRSVTLELVNLGTGELPQVTACEVTNRFPGNVTRAWLTAALSGARGKQSVTLTFNEKGLGLGRYEALLTLRCPRAAAETLTLPVRMMNTRVPLNRESVTLDDDRPGFFCMPPGFWVGHRLAGRGMDYRTNGGRPRKGAYARFTPQLVAGTWRVSLSTDTPFVPGASFNVRVKGRDGERIVRVEPSKSRVIGTFAFDAGTDGFVEFLAEGSQGMIMLNKVVFDKTEDK